MRTGNTAAAIKEAVETPAVAAILHVPGVRTLEVHGWQPAESRVPRSTRVYVRFESGARYSAKEVEIQVRMRRAAGR